MLINLHIKNIALIDELSIELGRGLNILSGETGAGKSIVAGSIGAGLGGKLTRDSLRDPDRDGLIELIFDISECESAERGLESIGIIPDDGLIIISRRITGTRIINRINDETVTKGRLKEVAEYLIDLHSQHEHVTLLRPAKHLEIIDRSDDRINGLKKDVSDCYKEYKDISDRLESLLTDESEREKRLDFLRFQIDEIESASLRDGEDTELEELYKKVSASHDILEAASEAYRITGYDDPSSAGNELSRAEGHIRALLKYDEAAVGLLEALSDIDGLLNDFNRDLSEYMKNMEFDPGGLQSTEERLNLINSLKMKYGRTVSDILGSLDGFKAEYESLLSFDETVSGLRRDLEAAEQRLDKASSLLTSARKKAADDLCGKIVKAMEGLNFGSVIFFADITPLPGYTASGRDAAVFMISTNVGEEPAPLSEVASGGELSRVMLAIKSVLADKDDMPTLLFDEIDTGISGITAQRVSDMMKQLSRGRQIISITHLPQIASNADHNYLIEKTEGGGRTYTDIRLLEGEERVLEIARMLGGDSITGSVMESAREMLSRGGEN